MSQPTVCAIMLTADRPEMAARAVRSFRAQTYANKRLLILDTGNESSFPAGHPAMAPSESAVFDREALIRTRLSSSLSIGILRNMANDQSHSNILIHWDSDDVSHSHRISEQVEHLVSSGADAVGYSDLLFWDTRGCGTGRIDAVDATAWLYHSVPNSCPGTSLCYWRKTWERKPFPDQPRPGFADGEDVSWVRYLNLKTVSSIGADDTILGRIPVPRLIASVHGRNTSGSYKRIGDPDNNFTRVPGWDDYCKRVMLLDRTTEGSTAQNREKDEHHEVPDTAA